MLGRSALALSLVAALPALGCSQVIVERWDNPILLDPRLYVPTHGLGGMAIDHVVIVDESGASHRVHPGDISRAPAGRLAVRLPIGVSTGTVAITTDSRRLDIPFHVVASIVGPPTDWAPPRNPACALVAGRWVGNITADPDATATVDLEVGGGCRMVRGFLHLESPRTGAVDATIHGSWDPERRRLEASDMQLFYVRPLPGGSFCPTARYVLALQDDGTLTGQNIVTARDCRATSPVLLHPVRFAP